MLNILIVGANRGLGESLAHQYAKEGNIVYATARHAAHQTSLGRLHWIPHIDITDEGAGRRIAAQWGEETKIDLLVICAGYFAKETLSELNYEKEVAMYKTVAIGPPFLVHHLVHAKLLTKGSKIVLVSGESGSIALRHESGGGGNYGGHGSKAALNMVGKLLSIDLKSQGIAVAMVHTGYLRKQNKDGAWDTGDQHGESRHPFFLPSFSIPLLRICSLFE
jgi:NAD(P)-dependent dehydrogenase (short-subunit alcohol dehydrogenase family)